ncbi:MAG TPA: peptide-methionine (S)-S-oxide reductase MsrA [Usitatibacteraceae bacterium]
MTASTIRNIFAAGLATLLFAASNVSAQTSSAGTARATFAGGCFWCMEAPFDVLPGVISTTSGYTGGSKKNPTYQEVSSGRTGHAEAVQVVYDPKKISYEKLLEVFWHNIDPTVKDQQFCDVGNQYRTAIFYHDEAQKKAAEASKAALQQNRPFKGEILTEITAATEFTPAEDYHQDFYKKNPTRYKFYRAGCGRDERLKALWGAAAGSAH